MLRAERADVRTDTVRLETRLLGYALIPTARTTDLFRSGMTPVVPANSLAENGHRMGPLVLAASRQQLPLDGLQRSLHHLDERRRQGDAGAIRIYAVRPEGAFHQWREVSPRELSI